MVSDAILTLATRMQRKKNAVFIRWRFCSRKRSSSQPALHLNLFQYTLTIWFRGNSDNAAETLYVALNGSAVVSHDNPDAAQIEDWTRWNIDLQAFGVNLANVNTIALGLGNKNNPQAGGSGTMYFDDIRLYPPAP